MVQEEVLNSMKEAKEVGSMRHCTPKHDNERIIANIVGQGTCQDSVLHMEKMQRIW